MKTLRNESEVSTVALVLMLTIAAPLMGSSSFIVFSSYTATAVNASGASASVNQEFEGIPPLESFWGAQN